MINKLADETSPYLKQHANNPVYWYPWEEEAFDKAKHENKPIHLSVGYAACHWCHVMAHESFENETIASILNEEFINIKVDRQERPDIDDVYQKVLQMQGQSGGWPLTIFMTADKKPFFGGTYFPPDDRYGLPGFLHLIRGISTAWKDRREELEQNIKNYLQCYQTLNELPTYDSALLETDMPLTIAKILADNTDPEYGGLGTKPKFPNPLCYDLMLRVYRRSNQTSLLNTLELTLTNMYKGGLYDHLGGGFSRYSVDQQWSIPHFEKMLYDNAQLVKLYADAYRMSGKLTWRHIIDETIEYVLRDLTHPEGGFYASEDADSEGVEGKFYVWSPAEVKKIVGTEDGEFACMAYGITEQGNFEHGKTVLTRPINLTEQEEIKLKTIRDRLFQARQKRIRPERDDNILTSWNALMIQGLCTAYQATGKVTYLSAAIKAANFLHDKLSRPNGMLLRVWNQGEASISGFLEDYAFLANAYLDLYESTFDNIYFRRAEDLLKTINDKFWDNGLYFTPDDGEELIHRPRSPFDSAWPSGISTSVFAMLRLYALTNKPIYRERADIIFKTYFGAAMKNPFSFAHLIAALEFSSEDPQVIVFAGDKHDIWQLAGPIYRQYLPQRVLARADDVPIGEGKTMVNEQISAYLCRHHTCSHPMTNSHELMDYLATY